VVIAGEVDEIIPVKKSEEMSAAFKNGRLVVVKGAGHMAMMEAPKEVADALRELATRVK
jgi:pimeloyl-ACP methyl ester carboxylesterase